MKHHSKTRLLPLRDAIAAVLPLLLVVTSHADEVRWAARTDVGSPEARAGHVMAYDSDRGITVLFGGHRFDEDLDLVYFNDTWEYNGNSWQRVTIDGPVPLWRTQSAMCYDSVRREMVLVAGFNGDEDEDDGFLKDTWVYRPAAAGHGVWTRKADIAHIFIDRPARAGHAMVFDSKRGVAVLMGGTDGENPYVDAPDYFRNSEVIEWNGESWYWRDQLFGLQDQGDPLSWYDGPTGHAMVFDSDEGIISISGGGYYYHLQIQGDIEWRDYDWAHFVPINRRNAPDDWNFYRTPFYLKPFGPVEIGRRQGHASVYDIHRKRIVIFGGHTPGEDTLPTEDPGGRLDEVEFASNPDGSGGYQGNRLYIPTPPVRKLHAMVYDSRRQRTVLFGGSRNLTSLYNDTWEYGEGVVPYLYVDAANAGPQDGSLNSPFKTARQAIDAAAAQGLTVISVRAGSYPEGPFTSNKPVRIESRNGPVTIH